MLAASKVDSSIVVQLNCGCTVFKAPFLNQGSKELYGSSGVVMGSLGDEKSVK